MRLRFTLRNMSSEWQYTSKMHSSTKSPTGEPVIQVRLIKEDDFTSQLQLSEKFDALRLWREMFFLVDDMVGSLEASPSITQVPPSRTQKHCSSEDAVSQKWIPGLKRKRATVIKRLARKEGVSILSLGLSTSTEEESSDASPTLAAKEGDREPLPPNIEAYYDSSAPVTHRHRPQPDWSQGLRCTMTEETIGNCFQGPKARLCDATEYKASCHWAVEVHIKPWFAPRCHTPWNRRRRHAVIGMSEVCLGLVESRSVEELHRKKQLTVPAAQSTWYIQKAYEELFAAIEMSDETVRGSSYRQTGWSVTMITPLVE
ncbi:hypothetical protein Tco_0974870 [Tanacetum coccineum]|uniref:Uncharacterized protein n=1 Tax=Tanacetum coccineum TaxID=301880 RepID=A0ABQ5ED23_9ASTR